MSNELQKDQQFWHDHGLMDALWGVSDLLLDLKTKEIAAEKQLEVLSKYIAYRMREELTAAKEDKMTMLDTLKGKTWNTRLKFLELYDKGALN